MSFAGKVRYAADNLRQQKAFTLVVILTLGVTMGMLFSVFALNYTLFYKPLPYSHPERLVVAKGRISDGKGNTFAQTFSYPSLVDAYRNDRVLDRKAMLMFGYGVITSVASQPKVSITYATPEYGHLLSVPILKGRSFEETEGLLDFEPVALISNRIWQEVFSGRVDVLGQSVELAERSYKVIGVVSDSFLEPSIREIGQKTDVWLPWDFNPVGEDIRSDWGNIRAEIFLLGERDAALTPEVAETSLSSMVSELWAEENSGNSFFVGGSMDVTLLPIRDVILGKTGAAAWLMLLAALGLLAISVTNVSNLFVSRVTQLTREYAIRASLGAKRQNLFVQLLTETYLLIACSFVLGVVVSQSCIAIMSRYLASSLPMVGRLSMDLPVLVLSVAAALLVGFVLAGLSIRSINYRSLIQSLGGGSKGGGVQVSSRVTRALIVVQMAVALLLIVLNIGLLADSLRELNQPLGFKHRSIANMEVFFSSQAQPSAEHQRSVALEIERTLAGTSGISAVAVGRAPTSTGGIWTFTGVEDNRQFVPRSVAIDEDYLAMFGITVLAGEGFTSSEVRGGAKVMLVNQTFARMIAPGGDVVGMQMNRFGSQTFGIKGVVSDIRPPGQSVETPRAYIPDEGRDLSFAVEFDEGRQLSREALAEQLRAVDPLVAVFNYVPVSQLISDARAGTRLVASASIALVLVVAALTAIGLVGVMGYNLSQRTAEIGIRIAVGAKFRAVYGELVREHSLLFLLAAIILAAMTGVLYGVAQVAYFIPNGQFALATTAALVIVALLGLGACYFQLWRLTRRTVICLLKGSY